jgi:cobalamin biosynthesis Mg chelatase CobN
MAEYGMTLADGTEWTIADGNIPSPLEYPSTIGLRDIFGGIKEVTSFALQTQQQLGQIQGAAEQNSFDRFMSSLSLDTNRSIAQSQAETAKVQAQASLAKAQQAGAPASYPLTGNSSNTIMMIAAVIGIVGVIYSIAKGK